jgi:threonine synthase
MGKLVCRDCGKVYDLNDARWKCGCGSVLDIEFKASIDMEKIKSRKPTMWRYREALPIERDENIVTFDEGFTPLLDVEIDGKKLFVKLEQLFTTGSYKDRGASVLISKAKELGIKKVVEDSSGNAGCAVAAYCARAGIECDIYVPEGNSPGKLAQIEMYGANLHKIPGTREDTAHAVMDAAREYFYASHSWNPFFFQGTKTYAYEVWEQLGFKVPDTLIIPVGNGTLLIGAYLGFKDLMENDLISSMPKIIGVQSANCAPLYKMFAENLEELPSIKSVETISEGIAIAEPVRGKQIVKIVRETGGEIITVTDHEVEEALVEVCRLGLYIEPTSASTIAGFKKIEFGDEEVVVAPLTGHGLKATEKLLKISEKYV